MQVIKNRWLIPIVVLASDRLFHAGLTQPNSANDEYRTKLTEAVLDYQNHTGNYLRNEDIEHAIDYWFEGGIDSPAMFSLIKISKIFLVWQGDCFEVHTSLLQDWLSLINYIDPAWIIAAAFKGNFGREVTFDSLSCLIEKQCHLALPRKQSRNTFSDNHVHLGGHGSSALSLLNVAIYYNRKPKKEIRWPRRSEHVLFEAGMLNKIGLPVWLNMLSKPDFSAGINVLKNHELLKIGPHSFIEYPPKSLMHYVLDVNEEGPKRWFVFCLESLISNDKKSRDFPVDLLIQCANILRSYMLVTGVGLGQFVQHFGFDYRKPKDGDRGLNYGPSALLNDLENNNQREFRVSPSVLIKNNKLKPDVLASMVRFLSLHGKAEQTHFTIHFTRGFPPGVERSDRALTTFRDGLVKDVRNFQQFFESGTYAEFNNNSEKKVTDLRKVIRGFDVAGNENELPIEVFAPSLRMLRSGLILPMQPYASYMRKPFLTIHAGEDYSHILSGIRAIDEAVEFCQMTEGDRIGHALALGVDVQDWAKRQQTVYIPMSDQLDNLVWLYHQAINICLISERFNACLAIIQQKIARYSSNVYGEAISPEVLYQGWLFRRNDPSEKLAIEGTEAILWRPDHKAIEGNTSGATALWKKYLNRTMDTSVQCDLVIAVEFEQNISILYHHDEQVEIIRVQELELYSAVQDFLLEKFAKRGLILEACPTSNITIGRFTSCKEHPIYRWNPPVETWLKPGEKFNRYGIRKGPVAVCINTDDAGLMPTTLENEHRLIEVTAIDDFHVSPLVAESWINSIRIKGNQVFDNNHLDWEVVSK